MNQLLQNLVEALREELKQYGEMLALLDEQQDLVVPHRGPDLLLSIAGVDAQAQAIRAARDEREQRRRCLARTLEQDEDIGFEELTLLLPNEYRPLIQALVQENNDLLFRIRQRARQNHLLLSRAMSLMQRFINSLVPGGATATYTGAG